MPLTLVIWPKCSTSLQLMTKNISFPYLKESNFDMSFKECADYLKKIVPKKYTNKTTDICKP